MTERTAHQIIDSTTVRIWDRCYNNGGDSALAEAYMICASARDEVAERDGIVWDDNHGWTTREMREEPCEQ